MWYWRTSRTPEPVGPLIDGEIAAAEPRERQQLLQLVIVLIEQKTPQFLEGGSSA